MNPPFQPKGYMPGDKGVLTLFFNRAREFIALLLALFLVFASWGCGPPPPAPLEGPTTEAGDIPPKLVVHFLDVGQGDSIFVQTPSQNILIDAGERSSGPMVVDYLQGQGVRELDLVLGTHPHSDHIGGLIQVLTDIPVKEIMDPAVVHTTKLFEDYLTLIDEKEIKFTEGRAGMVRDIGGASLKILHPLAPSSSALNDASIVTRISCGQISFLLTGDIEKKSEAEILDRGAPLKSTILKAGHHGSSSSNSPAFVEAVDPRLVIIMCGEGNDYGHPHGEVLETYRDRAIDIYRTDLLGTIVVTTDGETYSLDTEKEREAEEDYCAAHLELVASLDSDKYHRPDCRHIANIKPQNKIIFSSIKEAEERGYRPCKTCQPAG